MGADDWVKKPQTNPELGEISKRLSRSNVLVTRNSQCGFGVEIPQIVVRNAELLEHSEGFAVKVRNFSRDEQYWNTKETRKLHKCSV